MLLATNSGVGGSSLNSNPGDRLSTGVNTVDALLRLRFILSLLYTVAPSQLVHSANRGLK